MKLSFCAGLVVMSLGVAPHASAEERASTLTVRLIVSAPGAVVTRDGVLVGAEALGHPLPVAPGRHEVVVEAPQRSPRTFVVVVGQGEEKVLDVSPGAGAFRSNGAGPNAAVGDTEDSEHTTDFSRGTIGLSLGGAGLGAVGIGSIFGIVALSSSDVDESRSAGEISKGFLIGGAIAALAGAIIFFTAPRR